MSLPGPFPPADHPLQMEQACREAFGRLGASPFAAGEIAFDGAAAGFVPVSRLNTFRRELLDQLARQWEQAARDRLAPIKAAAATPARAPPAAHPPFRWLLKTDQPGVPDDFEGEDWTDCDEVILEITPAVARQFPRVLDRLAGRVGRDRIRLALPVILRQRETDALRRPVAECLAGGWTRWQTANLGGWTWLREQAPAGAALDWSADWPLYALNWPAAQSLLDLGAESLTLSPEDGLENWRQLLPALGPRAVVIVYQDTPLMISAHAAAVSAPGAGPSALRSAAGDELAVISGRPAVVINRRPLCLAEHLPALAQAGAGRLRADFICRPYAAAEARAVWRRLRSGQGVPGTHAANFSRGLA